MESRRLGAGCQYAPRAAARRGVEPPARDRARAQVRERGCRIFAARHEHQRVAVEAHDCAGDRAVGDELRVARARMVQRERERDRTVEHAAQRLVRQRIGATREQRARDDCFQHRRRGQMPADLFGQQRGIEQPRTRAALRLADPDAEYAGLRERLPEHRVEAQRLGRTYAGGVRLGGEQLCECVAQQLLFFG